MLHVFLYVAVSAWWLSPSLVHCDGYEIERLVVYSGWAGGNDRVWEAQLLSLLS